MRGGTLVEAFDAVRTVLEPEYGRWPIFEHCLPFNGQRYWDDRRATTVRDGHPQ